MGTILEASYHNWGGLLSYDLGESVEETEKTNCPMVILECNESTIGDIEKMGLAFPVGD